MDWISQILAALSTLVLGYLWYGPLFGKQWLKESGLTEEQIKNGKNPIIMYGIALLLAFVTSKGLYLYIVQIHQAFDSVSEYPFFHGMYHGFHIAIFFGAAQVLVTNALFNQRSWKFILINLGYWLLALSIMGGIIGVMN